MRHIGSNQQPSRRVRPGGARWLRSLGFLLVFALVVAVRAPLADASSSSATPAAVAPTAAAAPSLSDRLAELESARAKLVAQCQVGIAQHDGAIAVVRQMLGVPAGTAP